jgi:hypothetical protein
MKLDVVTISIPKLQWLGRKKSEADSITYHSLLNDEDFYDGNDVNY